MQLSSSPSGPGSISWVVTGKKGPAELLVESVFYCGVAVGGGGWVVAGAGAVSAEAAGGVAAGAAGGAAAGSDRWFVVGKLEVDGLDFERHLVGRGEQRLKGGVHGDDLIGPGIEAEEAGERHGSLLLEVLHVELGPLGHHGRKPEGGVAVALDEAVADHRLVEGLEGLDALLELLEVEAEVLLAIGEFLGAEQFQGFLGGGGVVRVGVVHGDAVEDGVSGEEQAIVEGVLGIQAVAEDDVRDLEGEDGVEVAHLLGAVRGDDGGGVEQALGDDDGVADGDGLQRLGEQGAATDGTARG